MQKNNSQQSNSQPINEQPQKPHIHVQLADDSIANFAQVNYLQVTQNQHEQRIDNFLMARLKGLPKTHIYKLIRNGEIRVNKSRTKPANKLVEGDIVRIAPVRLSTQEQPKVGNNVAHMLLKQILHEDEHIIVLNKPAGMAVHGGSGQSYGIIEAMRIATDKKYLELIHRIDKETSGILLIAKKRSALKSIQECFRQKTVKKQYLALVDGIPTFNKKIVDKPLQRLLLANGERRVVINEEGKQSVTEVQVLEKYKNSALILAKPHTGRTHQIRVHSLALGHPLLGDEKYNRTDISKAPRLCLHAWKIDVPNYGSFEAPLPKDLADFKQKL